MVSFALRTSAAPDVEAWLLRVSDRMKRTDYLTLPFSGSIRRLKPGLFALHIEPAYPRLLLNAFAASIMVGGLVAGMLGFYELARWLLLSGGVGVLVVNLFWTPALYQAVIWCQVRRLTGRFCKVGIADREVLRMVAHGKV